MEDGALRPGRPSPNALSSIHELSRILVIERGLEDRGKC